MTVLVDTSVLTRLARPDVRIELDRLGPGLTRATLTDLELGHSAQGTEEWDAMQAALTAFRSVDVEAHHFRRASQVQRMLASRGLRGRKVPDLLIAACAEEHGLEILHYDRDFDHISSVTGQPSRWIVAAGSID